MNPAVRETDVITYVFAAGTASPLVTMVVVTTPNKVTVDSLNVAVHSDIEGTPELPVVYQTPVASIPGTANITVDLWPTLALKTFKDGDSIAITDGTQIGIATLTVVSPAMIPGTTPVPDPIATYPCTLAITASQNKLISN